MNKLAVIALGTLLAAAIGGAAPKAPHQSKKSENTEVRYARSFDRATFGQWIPESQVPETPIEGPEQIIWEVSRYPNRPPTPEQTKAANALRDRCMAAAKKNGWFDYVKGRADGFTRQWNDENHFYNPKYVTDDAVLDPERPEYLMYYKTEKGPILAGFMFLGRTPMEQGPQIGGPLTVWHYHLANHPHCFRDGLVLLGHPEGGTCPEGVLTKRTPEMLHVWFVEHPEGHFATRMTLEPAQLHQALSEAKGLSCCSPE